MFASLRFSKNLSTANLSTISKITISCRTSSLVFVHVSISTEIAATFFTDNIRSAMNEGKYKGAIYIDLSKAFDTISHSILLKTLHNYGISGRSNEWLADYLFCRSQQVLYLGTLSSPQSIFCGVPQGSILGPLLFIVYFNDAANAIVNSKILMYADDTVLFCSHKDINTVQRCLEDDFRLLSQWLKDNELIVNFKKGKTEVMVFGTHPRLKKLQNDPIRIEHCGNMINSTTSYKYLGIKLTPSLNMTSHITDSIKKASTRIRLLRKTRSFMDTETANLVYQTLILPLFTYCSLSIYGATPEYLKRQIVKIENRVERIVGCPIQTCE